MWRRHPEHPILLMALACTAIVWMDPIMNWAPYAVYNPQLWHWPESWPLVSLSPTVEPFIVFGYVTFYFGPFFPAIWILRRLQARRPVESFVWRHPLISLAAAHLRRSASSSTRCSRSSSSARGLYIYSQVIPFGSVFAGNGVPVPVDLGVGVGDARDDPGGRPALPRRHRQDGGREAGARAVRCSAAVPRSARSA